MNLLGEISVWVLSALVLLGAVPSLAGCYQYLMLAGHRWRDHYDHLSGADLPRVIVLVPAWNEAAVLDFSIDRLLAARYPPDRLRVVIVDDGSDDGTAELLAAKQAQYPDRVLPLRRENGGQGKAHTLNHGLRLILAGGWADAVLITDADVVFEPTTIRRMVRHLADPRVGAVTAFIREASEPAAALNRFVGYEYCAAQAAGRRAQNVARAQACLAGGAQLLTRANLEALGGRVDTTTLAEDTVTTFLTQVNGRRVIFDGNAECLAEEPASVAALWKQRLRWSRGNIQVTRRFKDVFFRPSRVHRLGRPWFGIMWFSTLLLPAFMVISSAALFVLWLVNSSDAQPAFRLLWIITALSFVFTTTFTLLLDGQVARRSWLQALLFPGLISLAVMAWVLVPGPMRRLVHSVFADAGIGWTSHTHSVLILIAYLWVSVCMVAAWGMYRLDRGGHCPWLVRPLIYVVGFGPLLCAITFAAYIAEIRGTAPKWEKTEKTGKVGAHRES